MQQVEPEIREKTLKLRNDSLSVIAANVPSVS
jgi:hypothetical protein